MCSKQLSLANSIMNNKTQHKMVRDFHLYITNEGNKEPIFFRAITSQV